MTNKNKALGTALENRVVKAAQEAGLGAERQPLSGILERFPNDVVISTGPNREDEVLVECKVRSSSISFDGRKIFGFDLDWLKRVTGNAYANGFIMGIVVFASKHSQDKYVAMRMDDFLALIQDSTKPLT